MSESDRPFSFLRTNIREGKPRQRGITEIREPYYTPMGKRYLEDILETMGEYVDSLKFAGGSFNSKPKAPVMSPGPLAKPSVFSMLALT
jgi:phosphosulfolactate synthase (CoM biosynthesis protein A)